MARYDTVDEKIIKIFKANTGSYVSGEDLSKKLGVSRTSIWKHIESLRKIGYEIDAVPHLGYQLTKAPDMFIPHEISTDLGTKFIGKSLHSFKSTGSTNDFAYRLAEEGAPEGTVVLAEEQAKGRGRMGRQWLSPKGGIYLSLILRPKLLPSQAPEITLVAAVSVANAIRKASGINCLIKWPNDILVGPKKISGILTEMKAEQDSTRFVIVGIGVNVNIESRKLPHNASSISHELNGCVSKVEVVKEILRETERQYNLFNKKGFKAIKVQWKNLSAVLGKHVKIRSLSGVIEGQASDIDDSGALMVRLDNGFLERVTAGDVIIGH